jgi:hypothetical protein
MADNVNRRPQTDFNGLVFDDWQKTGAADRNARANKGGIQEDVSAREAAAGAKAFEGSFELVRPFTPQTSGTTESLSAGNQNKDALQSRRN